MEPDVIDVYELELERDRSAPNKVQGWLQDLPLDPSEDLVLLTHELIVNAVVHTTTQRLWLTLLVFPDVIHVQVANEGATRPRVLDRRPYSESGRGLRWVDAMSRAWGVGCTRATHVWFQVPRDERSIDSLSA
jgi:anti-sigma regulatory factor (Ser/Thr protein kinase)